MFQGDIYRGDVGGTFIIPYSRIKLGDYKAKIAGGHFLGRWEHVFSNRSDMALQLFYNYTGRKDSSLVEGYYHTVDLDFQHRFGFLNRHQIVWGFGYRLTNDQIENGPLLIFDPIRRSMRLISVFLQDEISLVQNHGRLILGSKFEHNDFTGFEIQPNVRLLWIIRKGHTVWGAVSRAVRTPSRAERDIRSVVINGNPNFTSEDLTSHELGYHFRALDFFSFDLSLFYNSYKKLQTFEPVPFSASIAENKKNGKTYGIELAAETNIKKWYRLQTAYSYLDIKITAHPDSKDKAALSYEGENPHHQVSICSFIDLPKETSLNVILRYVDILPKMEDIRSYLTMDARIGNGMNILNFQ
jgi:iron complex outermembrane receptor protein